MSEGIANSNKVNKLLDQLEKENSADASLRQLIKTRNNTIKNGQDELDRMLRDLENRGL